MSNWLTIIVALLIVLVIADGIRRTWKARRSRLYESPELKKSLKHSVAEDDVEEKPSYLSELPNGGARVVGYRDPKDIPPPKFPPIIKDQKTARPIDEISKPAPEQVKLNLSETVPILMQPADVTSVNNYSSDTYENASGDKYQRIEPTISSSQLIGNETNLSQAPSTKMHPSFTRAELLDSTYPTSEDKNEVISSEEEDDYEDLDDYDEDEYYAQDMDDNDDEFDDDEFIDEDSDDFDSDDDDWNETDEDELSDSELDAEEMKAETQSAPLAPSQPIEPEEVIVINVMAQRAQVFEGNALLDIVLKCGLRYGSMNIFHRYSGNKGDGTLLFSMANIVKPGTFDLDSMDEFTTLGVSLFLTLPLDADSLQSFELMLETSQAIAQTLDGELKDEYRSVMTKQTIEHYRQRIRDFERKKLFRRPQ